MPNCNSINNAGDKEGYSSSLWESLSDTGVADSPTGTHSPTHMEVEPKESNLDEKRQAVFQIYTENFRVRMAEQLAEEYLNTKSESNVETTDLDHQIEEENGKSKKTKFLRFFKKSKGIVKNEIQNGVGRSISVTEATKVILGKKDTEDPKLAGLRSRLDELTEQYIKQSKERYKKAVSEDSEHFNTEGDYEGDLAADGELKFDKDGTKRINHIISEVVSKRKEFIDESGEINEVKLTEYVSTVAKDYPHVVDECVEKCSNLLVHEISFDRAKDGMAIYSADLVGGTSRDSNSRKEILEKIKSGFFFVPNEFIAAAAGTAAMITRGDMTSFIAGVSAVSVTSGLRKAFRIGEDRRVVTEARTNNMETLGEQPYSDEIITGNGEESSVINGLTINDESMPVEEALRYSNNEVQRIRGYERGIVGIGIYEMVNSGDIIRSINEAIEEGDMQKIMSATAEAESRLNFTYDKGKAVIRFSSIENRSKEERDLREAIFNAKKIINESNGEDDDYQKILASFDESISKDIKSKDRVLVKRQIIEGLRQGLKAGVIAALGFVASQELIASFDDNTMGFFETMLGKNGNADKQTIASRLAFGEMQHEVQTGQIDYQTKRIDNLTQEEAERYRKMGWDVRQTKSGYSAAGYIIDGKPANIVFGDNNTVASDNLELNMRLVDGKLSMPAGGTATSSMDGGKTVLDWGEMAKNGEIGVVKILPDGTGEFIPGASVDSSSGRILLGDGKITQDDFEKYRFCATAVKNGNYTIFASEGNGAFIQQPIETKPLFSAILRRARPVVEKVVYGLSTIGMFPPSTDRASLGKLIVKESEPAGLGQDWQPSPEPEKLKPSQQQTPPNNPEPPKEPLESAVQPIASGAQTFSPSGINVSGGIPSENPISPIPNNKGAESQQPTTSPWSFNVNKPGDDSRFVFIDSELEGPEMLPELKRRFTAITGEDPKPGSFGVYESEHYIMGSVSPIASGPHEHSNVETDILDQPNIMYKISRKK